MTRNPYSGECEDIADNNGDDGDEEFLVAAHRGVPGQAVVYLLHGF
jgi:hypothetical protein